MVADSMYAGGFLVAAGVLIGFVLGRRPPPRPLSLLATLVALPAAFASPQQALAIAWADSKRLSPDEAYYTRYLDMTFAAPGQRREVYEPVTAKHVNGLSFGRLIVRPRRISGGDVVAINLKNYLIDPAVYDRLANVDPYFHATDPAQKVKITWPVDQKAYEVQPFGAWLNQAQAWDLAVTTRSWAPILRADWFFFQTAIQQNRVAGYYDFLGIGNKFIDLQRKLSVDVRESQRLRTDEIAVIDTSGVALNNRDARRIQGATGAFWFTDDYNSNDAVKRKNVTEFLDPFLAHFDASEVYFTLPNKLPGTALYNADEVRQDVAPGFVANNIPKAVARDAQVHVNLSCTFCHVEGLRPLDCYVRRVNSGRVRGPFKGIIGLLNTLSDADVRVKGQYFSNIDLTLAADRLVYANAVRECNDLSIAEDSARMRRAWTEYLEEPVTPAKAARELGLSEADFMRRLRDYLSPDANLADKSLVKGTHMGLTGYLNESFPRREHYERIFPLLQAAAGNMPPL